MRGEPYSPGETRWVLGAVEVDKGRIWGLILALLCLWPLGVGATAGALPEVPEAARSEGISVNGVPRAELRLKATQC